ncbi:MAG TPA: hypothetical protein DCE80_13160 [Ignavibacteriales bacterium]|nr:hypothetical protein [Ignavibacteriales bacterium]
MSNKKLGVRKSWLRVKPPTFCKSDVKKLLELIAGGEKQLTVMQLQQWRGLIMYAIASMRSGYENSHVRKDYSIRVYYQKYWDNIKLAKKNGDREMVNAIEDLRGAIQWE